MRDTSTARREFLVRMGQGAAVAATGGLIWSYLLREQAHATPTGIRPPGALLEADFNARCIKCGQCVRACPYATLKLATVGEAVPVGTPYYTPRDIPCYMCKDIPCKAACPTGALDPGLTEINESRMGLAVIDSENCLSWQGLRCEICHRVCPLQERAITVEHHPRRLSKHALFVPVVHSDYCTGCGLCEQACPTDEAAIRVLPPELVEGKIGEHYRLGWTVDTPVTQEFKPRERRMPEPEAGRQAAGLDYLNGGKP